MNPSILIALTREVSLCWAEILMSLIFAHTDIATYIFICTDKGYEESKINNFFLVYNK